MTEPQRPDAQDASSLSGVAPPAQEHRFDEAEFLRRTFDRSIQEIERSRTYFEKLLKWTYTSVVLLISVGIGVFVFFWFRSWSDIQKQMNTELMKTKDAIVEEGRRTIAETEKDILVKAANIFKEDNIKIYIRDVAREKTGSELSGIIKQTVNDKVALQIKAEEPQIRNTVVAETKKAVKELNPIISSEVKSQVDKQSAESLKPLREQVQNYQEVVEISTMALLARNGSGGSYDQIRKTASSTKDPNIKAICFSTLSQIYVDMNSALYSGRVFAEKKSPEEMKNLLDDPNPFYRWAAVDGLAGTNDNSLVPTFMEMSNHDENLWVRRAAYEALKPLTHQKFENFQQEQWNKWWEQNKERWPPK